jgi:GT2 family glycosyltransferase
VIHVCVPVLRRYDLLRDLLLSLRHSTVVPEEVYVIDNGKNAARLSAAVLVSPVTVIVKIPDTPMGVAESWNWFIMNAPEDRVIANDDVAFAPESLEKMAASEADLAWASGFSCFMIRDACVEKVGLFDETISPGYGYYEDEDYLQRLDGRGTRPRQATAENVDCGVVHLHSQTLKAASHAELMEHHRRFKVAQGNYMRKWGLTTL